MKKTLLLLLFITLTHSIFSQNSLTDQLNRYISQWQKGESVADIKKQLLQSDQDDVLSEIERFAADTNVNKRYAIYRLLGDLGITFDKPKSRTRAIKQLVFGTNDPRWRHCRSKPQSTYLIQCHRFRCRSKIHPLRKSKNSRFAL